MKILFVLLAVIMTASYAYDPNDKEITNIIPPPGMFEAFYPRETQGIPNSAVRASHNHASFFQHRNPGNDTNSINRVKFCNFQSFF